MTAVPPGGFGADVRKHLMMAEIDGTTLDGPSRNIVTAEDAHRALLQIGAHVMAVLEQYKGHLSAPMAENIMNYLMVALEYVRSLPAVGIGDSDRDEVTPKLEQFTRSLRFSVPGYKTSE